MEQTKLTLSQFKNQLRLLLRPVKQLIVDLIEKPVEGISLKLDNNIYTLDGMPLSIEGNEQLIEIEDGSLISILSNGFWDTVIIHIVNGEIRADEAGRGGVPILVYPDSVVYYQVNGVINCCYVLALNREVTLFPTVKYNVQETVIRIQDTLIDLFTRKLEEKLDELIKKIKVLQSMIEEKTENIVEEELNELIMTFEDAIILLPNRKFENKYLSPEYVVDFFLKGIESIQYFERLL